MKPIRIKHSNKKRAEWKEKGLCSQCGKAKQDKNKSYCNKCRDYFRAYKEKNKK